jgi:hypothetical protein
MSPRLAGDRNQCPTCSEFFNSVSAFDKHRVGEHSPNTRRCLAPAEMIDRGMAVNRAGFWVGARMVMDALPARTETHSGQDRGAVAVEVRS